MNPPDSRNQQRPTITWWLLLCAASAINAALWVALALAWPAASGFRRWQLLLSAVFVVVCAFRSAFPRVDLERRCLWDTPLSSIALGRGLATVAEMAFIGQISLLFDKLATLGGAPWISSIGWGLLPLIAVAQVACWYAVVTRDHLGHAIEEMLWGAMVALVAVVLVVSAKHLSVFALVVGLVACAAAFTVMVFVDIPMYFRRRAEHTAAGARRFGLAEGFRDALLRRAPTRDFADWRPETIWMTPYFTLAVWLSLGMTQL
jgi:hypothetical protein